MKKTLLFIFSITASFCNGQNLDFNSVSAGTGHAPGVLFTTLDSTISSLTPGYEIPKGNGVHAMFNTSIWCSGLDAGGALRVAAMKFGQNGHDFYPGPISSTNDYAVQGYIDAYGDLSNSGSSKWYISKNDVQNHISNWNQSGYVMPQSITNWPGNGVANVGVAQNLAPFVDMNNNDIYEPALGDYPDIRGDAAYYMIINDFKAVHTASGGLPLGIEIHTMMYQYTSADYLDSTTFLNFRIFNRGGIDLTDFKFGLWTDFDLGNGLDDFVGCDSINNLMFVYNGDNNDEGAIGYGVNPPAVGITSLNKPMNYSTYFDSNLPGSSSFLPVGINNNLSGSWGNGAPWLYGDNGFQGTYQTNYVFNGNPDNSADWTMISNGTIFPGDMRSLMAVPIENLIAGEMTCHDFAVLYSRVPGQTANENASSLINLAALAKTDYDAMTGYNCDQVTLGTTELEVSQIGLFPNPTSGKFTLSFGEGLISGQITVTDMKGSIVFQEKIQNSNVKILNLDTINGIYNVSIITASNTVHKKLIITE